MKALIVTDKNSTVFLVIDQAGVECVLILWINRERSHLTVSKARIRRFKRSSAVVARQHAATIRCEQDVLRIADIHQHIIHDHVSASDPSPGLSCIARLPQSFGGSCIDEVTVAWILLQHPSATGGERNALNFVEQLPGGVALINTGASAQIDVIRLRTIHDDREDVGIIGDSVVDRMPVLPAIGRLPRQVPGSGINSIRIFRINGDRLDVLDLCVIRWRHAMPIVAAIIGAEHTVERADHDDVFIRRRNRHCTDAFVVREGKRRP